MTEKQEVREITILTRAFESDACPPLLSVGLVSLIELSQQAMPSPSKVRAKMAEGGLQHAPQKQADAFGRALAFDSKMVAGPVRNLRHELYTKTRHQLQVGLLVTEADSDDGPLVFCSSIFNGAIEADVVKAVAHVTKHKPVVGGKALNADGALLRRVFWDLPNLAGVRFIIATGPDDIDSEQAMRAVTAFNKATK